MGIHFQLHLIQLKMFSNENKSEFRRIKFEVFIRSVSYFCVFLYGYMILRGLIETSILGEAEVINHLKQNYDYHGLLLGWIIAVGCIFVPITVIYTFAFGAKKNANFKIVIPAVLLVILFLELFAFLRQAGG